MAMMQADTVISTRTNVMLSRICSSMLRIVAARDAAPATAGKSLSRAKLASWRDRQVYAAGRVLLAKEGVQRRARHIQAFAEHRVVEARDDDRACLLAKLEELDGNRVSRMNAEDARELLAEDAATRRHVELVAVDVH